MQAIYYEEFQGPVEIRTIPDPTPSSHGVVIEVQSTGLCLSDWHGWMGHDGDIRLPHVPGHELAGVVAATGTAISNFQAGDRITVPFVNGCGHCSQCYSGNQQVCNQQFQPGFTAWGSFAEYVAIDYADFNLVRLSDGMSFDTAASLGCRFATSFRGVVDQGRIRGGEWVAVFGCGGVGLSAIMIAVAMGAQVIAVDIQDSKLELAKQLGAVATINSKQSANLVEEIQSVSKGGVHLSVDAIGHPDVVSQSISSLRKRGRHVQLGLLPPAAAHAQIPINKVIAWELELYGSHGMQAHRYPDMMRMIENGSLQPEKLLHSIISLEEAKGLLTVMPELDQAGIYVIHPNP